MHRHSVHTSLLGPLLAAFLSSSAPALAQDTDPDAAMGNADAELATKVANPVANLISVPLQNNIDCCYGPEKSMRYTLNLQPVIPVPLGDNWRIITRTILPFVYQQSPTPGVKSTTGFGDITQSFFISPTEHKNGITWALGPVFVWPIGDSDNGGQKWGAGPTGILLKETHGRTFGILANHVWSYAGDHDRDKVSTTLLQPFVSRTFPSTISISLNAEARYDWTHDKWTVPINASIGRLFKFGKQPVQIAAGAKYYAVSPGGDPQWGARLTMTFLFPE